MSRILSTLMKVISLRRYKCVKIENINSKWHVTLCDNCGQGIILCGPGEMLIKSWPGPMSVFCTFTEGYKNQEHT